MEIFIFKTEAGGGEGAGVAPSVSARMGEGKQDDHRTEPSLGYMGRSCLKTQGRDGFGKNLQEGSIGKNKL